ncbi:hypothetical protein KAR91_31020 [Candidatus Pacearchaeota archaeon]|nr:hypothetical protein [Candidatus Pacearchaeota archaeon]
MSLVIKTRIHWDPECFSTSPSPSAKRDFTNKYISKSEFEMHVIGSLPMLRDQVRCPSCSRWIRIEYHDKNNKHQYVLKNTYQTYQKYRCKCGRSKEVYF